MSGLALIVRWDGHPPDAREARLLASAAPHRSRAGTRELPAGCAFAISLDSGDVSGTAVAVSADRSILLVADARIDNAADLSSELDLNTRVPCGAAELLLAAYERWGTAFADRVAGDFAAAVWDGPRRRLLLARDAMAMRPLVYSRFEGRTFVASDPSQILAAGGSRRLNEAQIVARLAGGSGRPEWSYYLDIHRVPPGSTVVLNEIAASVHRHALDDVWDSTLRDRSIDYAAELRERLLSSVAARLRAAKRPGLLLSGGLDSLAIAASAAAARRARADLPALSILSFAYDDLPDCDERDTSEPVAAHYGFPSITVSAADAWTLAGHPDHGPFIEAPERLQSHVLLDRTAAHARAHGIDVLMSGQRGDSLFGSRIFDYLGRMRDAGPLALWRDLAHHSRREGSSRVTLFRRHVLALLAQDAWPRALMPRTRARVRRAVRGDVFPSWLRRDAIRRFDLLDVPEAAAPPWVVRGEARRRRRDRVFSARDGRATEAIERALAGAGLSFAAPWADLRLAALAVSAPQHVVTPAGEPKGLLREAMRGLLPETARVAARKRTPEPLYDRGLRRSEPIIRALIRGSRAAARGYVDETALAAAYDGFLAGRRLHRERFWRFLDVEDWLRRYHD